jgi:hypothetical protein
MTGNAFQEFLPGLLDAQTKQEKELGAVELSEPGEEDCTSMPDYNDFPSSLAFKTGSGSSTNDDGNEGDMYPLQLFLFNL